MIVERRTWLRSLRFAIVALALGLSAYLLWRGDVVIGGLIGASAVLRLTFLLSTSRSRRRGGAPSARATRTPPGAVRQLLRGLAPHAFEVAARAIGVGAGELRAGFRQGRPIAEVAKAKGVPVDAVIAAVTDDAAAAIDRSVAEGATSADVASRAKQRLPMWAARLIYGTRGEFEDARARP